MNEYTVCDRLTVSGRRLTLVALLTLVVAVSVGGAAGATTVRLTSADVVGVSETTTVDVVVDDADHGVGAYNVTVALTNPSIASITDVELKGDPSEKTSRVDLAPDGSTATLVAALMDTDDTGDVTIASVTVRAEGAGSTELDLTVNALGDERGGSYTTETRATSLSIGGDGATLDGSSNDGEAAAADSSSNAAANSNARLPAVASNRGYLVLLAGLALVALVALRRLS